ncbi:shK domain-like domain-containing protein [Ditylenchus destructor]|nr:shK domain-like domain-containing protein [Ditylenchus destructor]
MIACSLLTATITLINLIYTEWDISINETRQLAIDIFHDIFWHPYKLYGLCLLSAQVFTQLKATHDILSRQIPNWIEKNEEVARTIKRFTDFVAQSNAGITVGGMIVITKSLILTCVSLSVPYIILCLQHKGPNCRDALAGDGESSDQSSSDCPNVADLCDNHIYRDLMREQCPSTCGYCNDAWSAGTLSSLKNTEVEWEVALGGERFPIRGTLTESPLRPRPRGVVLILGGSGPIDRNWCLNPMPPNSPPCNGQLIGELFARLGYATLRFDKINSGPRLPEITPQLTANPPTMQHYMREVDGAIQLIRQRYADPKNSNEKMPIFVLTNSEGGIRAVQFQLEYGRQFDGMILTGMPGRPMKGAAEEQMLKSVDPFVSANPSLDAGQVRAAILNATQALMDGDDVDLESNGLIPPDVKQMLQFIMQDPVSRPYFRELWAYDLETRLREFSSARMVPTLIVIGKKDIQISWEMDGTELERILAGSGTTAVSFAYPEEANHVMGKETGPMPATFADAMQTYYSGRLDDGAMRVIADWLDAWFKMNRKKMQKK